MSSLGTGLTLGASDQSEKALDSADESVCLTVESCAGMLVEGSSVLFFFFFFFIPWLKHSFWINFGFTHVRAYLCVPVLHTSAWTLKNGAFSSFYFSFPESHNVGSGWNRHPAHYHHYPAVGGHHWKRKWIDLHPKVPANHLNTRKETSLMSEMFCRWTT